MAEFRQEISMNIRTIFKLLTTMNLNIIDTKETIIQQPDLLIFLTLPHYKA